MFVLDAKLCIIYTLILEVFRSLNLVFYLFRGVLLKKSGLIFKSPVATQPPTRQVAHAMCSLCVSCITVIYPC